MAAGSRSFATIEVAKGISWAYRTARNPVAESASSIVNAGSAGFGTGCEIFSAGLAVALL